MKIEYLSETKEVQIIAETPREAFQVGRLSKKLDSMVTKTEGQFFVASCHIRDFVTAFLNE